MECICKFVKDNVEMIASCFDDYYFIIPEGVIKPIAKINETFKIGDLLPIEGDTYEFPENFNVIDLHFYLVAKVRDGKFSDLIPLEKYEYDNNTAFNIKGFAMKISSKEEFEELKRQQKSFSLSEREKLADFANRWMDIVKYRKIGYK